MIAKSKKTLHSIIVALFALMLFIGALAAFPQLFKKILPEEYTNRIYSMGKYDVEEEDVDLSAAHRLVAWGSALEMIRKNPLTGVGFFRSDSVIQNYPDPFTGIELENKAIHNTILQVGAEMGLPALSLYILIFFLSFHTLGQIKKQCIKYTMEPELENYVLMFQAAFVGFFVSAFFVNAAHIDISWHMVGLTIALQQIAAKEIRQKVQAEKT